MGEDGVKEKVDQIPSKICLKKGVTKREPVDLICIHASRYSVVTNNGTIIWNFFLHFDKFIRWSILTRRKNFAWKRSEHSFVSRKHLVVVEFTFRWTEKYKSWKGR